MNQKPNNIETIFSPNSIYQISLISTSETTMPSATTTTNAKLVVAFKITSIPNGTFQSPKFYVIYRLNTINDVVRFENNEESELYETALLKVTEEIRITFNPNKRYEFFAAWLKPDKEHLLQEFFVASEHIKQDYGRPAPQFKVPFNSLSINPDSGVTFSPQVAGLVEWDTDEDVVALLRRPEFASKAAPLFEEAIDRMEMVLGQSI